MRDGVEEEEEEEEEEGEKGWMLLRRGHSSNRALRSLRWGPEREKTKQKETENERQ